MSFKLSAFGLHNFQGNASTWTRDCWVDNYKDAPTGGSARTTANCGIGVLPSGGWINDPRFLRAAKRLMFDTGLLHNDIGFRVALGWQDLNR